MGATSEPLSEEIVGKSVDLKQCVFLLHIHEGTPIKSHIAEFFSIINDQYKIEVKIEDEDQIFYHVLYLLYIRTLGKLSTMEASQHSRSMRSRSICSTRTKLIPS